MPGNTRLTNKEVVQQMKEMAAAMEVKGVNQFRIRAYQNAISSVDNLTASVQDIWEDGRLEEITGVGSSIAQHLDELFRKGSVKEWEKTKEDLPEGMYELLKVRGIGPKTAFKLAKEFALNSRDKAMEQVKKAAEQGKIRQLDGFGEKSEQDILSSIVENKERKQERKRLLLYRAETVAQDLINYLKECEEVEEANPLGSLRRKAATIGDIDLAVSSRNPEAVMDHFVKYPDIVEVEKSGDKMTTVRLGNEMQVDLLISEPAAYGSMLQHFTGSKQHNIVLRSYAQEKNLSLSQYGIKDGEELKEFSDEKSFYKYLGLEYIPPELREGKEEVQLALENKLPDLVELKDIKGDLHVHTIDSDGKNTLKEMVEAGLARGYKYIGISDHSPSVQSRGRYDVLGIIETKRKQIEQINDSEEDIRVYYGYEVNILADATLSLPNDILEKLDYIVASIHTSFGQSRKEITNRLISAIENPHVTIIGHPSGRLINERDAVDTDWKAVFQAAKKHNKILEINSQPDRLDLADDLVREAVNEGIRLIINSDSHSTDHLDLIQYGVSVARRGWAEPRHIINTLPLEKFAKEIEK